MFSYLKELVRFQQLPADKKRVTFYSEGRNYWVHLRGIIHALRQEYSGAICYVSSDRQDPGLQESGVQGFLTDSRWMRNWLFENIDTEVLVMTMPDLQHHQIKRSRHAVHYVYTHHSPVSLHMVYRSGAFDYYDTLFCVGPHHAKEAEALRQHRPVFPKQIIACGYSRFDQLRQEARELPRSPNAQPHALLAPSWGEENITETVADVMIEALLSAGYRVTLRPHPQSIRLQQAVVRQLVDRFCSNEAFSYEDHAAGTASLHHADIMISDWSGAALEYAFALNKPVIYINTPKKVNNPHYTQLHLPALEDAIRKHIGPVIEVKDCGNIADIVRNQLSNFSGYGTLAEENIYNSGNSDKVAAQHIASLLQPKDIRHG